MFVYVGMPELELVAAIGGEVDDCPGPVAVVADAGHRGGARIHAVGAEAFRQGVREGMGLATAVDLCPGLKVATADPVGADQVWGEIVELVESLGAELEVPRPGEAFFEVDGLTGLYGGLGEVVEAVFEVLPSGIEIGVAGSRLGAATSARGTPGEVRQLEGRSLDLHLASLPVEALIGRLTTPGEGATDMIEAMSKLGIATLGELAGLPRDAVADRFGEAGLNALDLAVGIEPEATPRTREQEVTASLDMPDGDPFGRQIAVAVEIVSGRLATELTRLGLATRSVVVEAELREGGSWTRTFSPKVPTSTRESLELLLAGIEESFPGPPASIRLRALGLTEQSLDQTALFRQPTDERRRRLEQAMKQVGATIGGDAILRIVETSPDSRLPERRVALVPRVRDMGR